MQSHTKYDVGGLSLAVKAWRAEAELLPPVVLLHGTASTSDDWDVVAESLRAHRPVFAVDLRGHGRSDWPGEYSIDLLVRDVLELLPQLDHPQLDVVGHSLGGLVACKVAAMAPRMVRRLVLEDVGIPSPRPADPPERPEGPLSFDWRMVEQIRPEIDDPDPRWREVAMAVTVPMLVIAGGESSLVPQAAIRDLVEVVPEAQMVTIDAGHLIHGTRPDEFLDVLTAFLSDD